MTFLTFISLSEESNLGFNIAFNSNNVCYKLKIKHGLGLVPIVRFIVYLYFNNQMKPNIRAQNMDCQPLAFYENMARVSRALKEHYRTLKIVILLYIEVEDI